ncbi:glycosyl hydrolase [Pseudokineococcus sp. 5B2Z-1]|uniref:glycoside hydrolase family 26 protein n=1 Tax=Pseudokineococcus sp. 5B2Z-1 TaxID=3132744 RepID=UPI0030B750F2
MTPARPPRPRRAAGAVLAATCLVAGATACAGGGPVAVGVVADAPAAVDAFAEAAGAAPALVGWYQAWAGEPAFDAARADAAVARGAVPMLTWEPWDPAGGAVQPAYAPAAVARGDHDAYLRAFARQVRAWGGVLALRPFHEQDADHYPWGVGVGGTTAEDLVAAWHHLRGVFAEEGADVVWVWSVNVHAPGSAAYAPLHPGDDAVDWVGLDGYNAGDALPWGGWRSPEELLGPSLDDLEELTDRPVLLTEVASAEQGGDKAAWVGDLLDLASDRGLAGVVWFDLDKEADWRVASSPEAEEALGAAVAEVGTAPLPVPERFGER